MTDESAAVGASEPGGTGGGREGAPPLVPSGPGHHPAPGGTHRHGAHHHLEHARCPGPRGGSGLRLVTGRQVSEAEAAAAADAIYVNLGLVDLDEGSGLITIAVSGNRNCAGTCPTLTVTLTALDDAWSSGALAPIGHADAALRGPGLQPVGAAAGPRPTQPLPLRRLPALARGGRGGDRGGRDDPPTRPGHGGRGGTITVQNRISDLVMPPPSRSTQAQRARPPTRPRSSPCSPCGSSARPTSSACR